VAAAMLKDPQRAKGLAETAGQLRPNNPDVMAAQALVLAAQDPKAAAAMLVSAGEAAAEDPSLPMLLGVVYASMGANPEAVDALKRATTLAPDFDDAWFVQGKVYREMGRSGDALRCFAEVSRIDPKRADAWIETADLQANTGDDVAALRSYEKALEAQPANPASICAMGDTLIVRMGDEPKNFKRGIEMLERCTKLAPGHPTAWHRLGDAYAQINKKREAIAAYKTHLTIAPDDAEAKIVRDNIVELGGKP
jgi:tetratricopeptide (TPR) repeat protein